MIKFSLYENAIDSITHGIEHLEKGHKDNLKTDYKQSILLIFQGTELLLKSLVSQIDVIYIFDKNSLYEKSKNFLEPTLEELEECKSLEIDKICNIVYKYYPKYFPTNSLNIVKKMAKVRNKIQHFGIVIKKNDIMALIGKLYLDVISKVLKLIRDLKSFEKNETLDEELGKIFDFFHNATNEEKMLTILGKDFYRVTCANCNEYSLFIFYDNTGGYPENIYCTSCDFEISDIPVENFRECPECSRNSLIYNEEIGNGICLWYRCANNRDGGIPVEMHPCDKCKDYVIEGKCSCGYEESDEI